MATFECASAAQDLYIYGLLLGFVVGCAGGYMLSSVLNGSLK